LVGTPADYTITQEDGNTRISYQDDLIAIVEGTPNLSVLPFFSRDGRFFLASLDAEGFAESTEFNFYEDLYLDLNPDVVAAIANGEYESAFDHYAKVGRLEGREGVIFNGTGIFGGNDIVTDLGGDGEAALIGVPISNLEIDEATEQFGIETASDGTGEIDALIGTEAMNLFVLGKNGSLDNPTPTPFYVGNGDSDYAKVWDFDTTADFLFLAGSLNDYIFEGLAPYAELDDDSVTPKWEKETKIYTKEGDLVAIIDGIDSLTPFPANNPGGFYLVSGENTHLAETVEPTFFEPYYLIQNPDVQGLIDAGEYASAYDHFIQVGQFEKREDTFFNGTEGDDVITALGYESIITGVPISEASYAGGIDIKPTNLGSGQVDTLMGGLGYESFIMLGNGTVLNDTPNSFYLGNGDADYARIKGFTVDYNFAEERYNIYHVPVLGGDGTKYTYESIDGDTHISLNGDLVAIVEDVPILIPDAQGEGLTYLYSPDFDAWYTDTNTPRFFAEETYLANNPDVQSLIDTGEYESGIDHFLHKGIFEAGRIAVYQGTAGNDNEVWGTGTSIIFGVEVTDIDTESLTYTTGSTGVGEVDLISGTPYANTFVLGNNGESFYVGNGDEDYVTVEIFDATKDRVLLAGAYEDYTFETVAGEEEGKGDLKILTKEKDLVAIVKSLGGKVADLKSFTGSTPDGATYLISLENEFFSIYAEPYFYADIYPIQNPDVDALIAAGEYTSYYDHFLKAGQFEEREDTFFVGTEGNDILYALGYETVLVGVPIEDAIYRPSIDVVPLSLGEGEIDVLYGGNTFEAIYVLGSSNLLNETPQAFYMGEGDADYALIKDFSPNDIIRLGDDTTKFTQEVVDGNLKISKDGDLIAIVENTTDLLVTAGDEGYNLTKAQAFIEGTAGDDTIELSGADFDGRAIGVDLVVNENYRQVATSNGTGEFDTFDFVDTEAANYIYLGFITENSPDTPETFYLGNGDADYALIKNINGVLDYPVLIPGKFEDYEVEIVDGNTRISKEGDLIAIIEDDVFVPESEADGYLNLYSSESQYYVATSQPFFNEDIYFANNPDAADAVAADQYASGFEHFMKVGLLEGRYAYYGGTSGDDGINAIGNSYVTGVPITGFDTATEQFTTETMGMGEVDSLTGTVGVNKFILGGSGESFYLGEGAADSATVSGFDILKDFIFLAGTIEDYSLETIEGSLNISQDGDLVSVVEGIESLEVYTGNTPDGGFYLVGSELQPEPETPTPIFGSTDSDTIDVVGVNQLVFAGAGNDLIDAIASEGDNRIYAGTGDDTLILGSKDVLTGQDGDDRFFVQTGGDNSLTGGMGADQFWLANGEIPTSANMVTDFTLGEDVIGIAGIGASFETLTLTQEGMNALVAFDGNDLAILKGIQVTDLNGDSFAFV
jgi:hypothetical protein